MDILDSAQKQINDAAGEMSTPPVEPAPQPIASSPEPPLAVNAPTPEASPSPPPEPTPELPKPEEPKELKEEAVLPEPSTDSTAQPSIEPPKPEPTIETNPLEAAPSGPQAVFTPSVPEPETTSPEPPQATTFGGTPLAEVKPEVQPFVPPENPKKPGGSKTAILVGLFLLLVTLPIGVYFISQQQRQITEQRSKAAGCISCPGGSCPDGFSYGPDNCAPQSSCGVRAAEACSGHQRSASSGTTTTTSGGGSIVGLPDSQNSGCCTTNTECTQWFGPSSTCANPNGACGSGKQCKGGGGTGCHSCLQTDCNAPGCGGQTCNAGCPTKCGNGVCENGETNANCPADCKAPVVAAATGCGANGAACCDPFSTGGKICNTGLFCNTATGKCGTTAPNNLCQSGATPGTKCAVFTCGTKCNNGNQCNLNEQIVDCSSASLGGQCGQIDFLDTSNAYCGVQSQNCGGSCIGGAPPALTNSPSTPVPTTTPVPAQCVRVKIYQGTAQVDPTTLKAGDNVILAVNATSATKGRIRVNGGAFTETATQNANGEFTVPFTIPPGVTTFTIEAEVLSANGTWQ